VVQLTRPNLREQIVADPVRLDHARIERIADARRARDQAQVRHGTAESTQQLGQTAVYGCGDGVGVQGAVVVATAVTKRFGMQT